MRQPSYALDVRFPYTFDRATSIREKEWSPEKADPSLELLAGIRLFDYRGSMESPE